MFAEDLTPFFNSADFAITATYKAGGIGTGVPVKVIFDAPGIDQFGITGTNPVALGAATDFASFANTDTLTIGAALYRILQCTPQSDGAVVEMQLEKQ
jgi:hypothetical protein